MTKTISRMVITALFTALAYITVFVLHINVPPLTFDLKSVFITLCGLICGPLYALASAALVCTVEFLTISDTGVYGLIMNFIASASLSVTAAIIYRYKRTLGGALGGLCLAVGVMTPVMLIANLFITPYYMNTSMQAVIDLILPLLLPFNLLKGAVCASVVFLLYKPLMLILRKTNLLPASAPVHSSKKILFIYAAAMAVIVVSVVALIMAMNGSFYLIAPVG